MSDLQKMHITPALAILALLTGCAAIPSPQPQEGIRAPQIPMVTIWRKVF